MWGYYTEEYGLIGKKIISRQEHDDGAAIINGKIVDASNSELRLRHLTPYNFIIAASNHLIIVKILCEKLVLCLMIY